jgi:hypothetical protein
MSLVDDRHSNERHPPLGSEQRRGVTKLVHVVDDDRFPPFRDAPEKAPSNGGARAGWVIGPGGRAPHTARAPGPSSESSVSRAPPRIGRERLADADHERIEPLRQRRLAIDRFGDAQRGRERDGLRAAEPRARDSASIGVWKRSSSG